MGPSAELRDRNEIMRGNGWEWLEIGKRI